MRHQHSGRRAFIGGLGAMWLACASGVRAQVEEAPAAQQPRPDRPLLRAFPGLRSVAWLGLGGLPTPVRLLRPATGLWVKDDGLAGEVYGGSKARKLELLLGRALSRGARHIVTSGAIASNHALATAVHARRHGLACTLLLLPAPRSPEVRPHLLAEHALGARLVAARRSDVREPRSARRRHGIEDDAIFLPLGGSSALGNLGYVNAGFELADQVRAGLLPEPRYAVVAAGTGGAAAGLAVGLKASGLRTQLLAVQTSSTATRRHIERAAAGVIELLRRHDATFPAEEPVFLHESRFLGPGYGRGSAPGNAAVSVAAEAGLSLDRTYTGKAFAALLARSGRGPTLFWNTWDARAVPHPGAAASDLPPRIRSYMRAP